MNNNFKKNNIYDQKGVAIIMVLAAIALLTFVIYDFTFETKVNSIRVFNQQNKVQAKLNAEAGIKLAISKLKLYKEGYNLIEKNKSLRDVISPSLLQTIITAPFVYPIPIPPKADIIQKKALEEFEKNTLINGTIILEIMLVSGFLNPNNMRVNKPKSNDPSQEDYPNEEEDEEGSKSVQKLIEDELTETLRNSIEQKKEDDENFDTLYGDINPELMIKELKYYVSQKDTFEDELKGDIENNYLNQGIAPKFAPLTSLSEMYLLEGWTDDLVELMKDKLTVHEVAIIPLNELTSSQLKILFPKITKEQSESFFLHRDGDPSPEAEGTDASNPHKFKSENDFKEVITIQLEIATDSVYSSRMDELKKAGLKLGIAGKLFKVISTGKYNSSQYKINAYVDLPLKPIPTPTPTPTPTPIDGRPPSTPSAPKPTPTPSPDEDEEKNKYVPQELLNPRIIEIYHED